MYSEKETGSSYQHTWVKSTLSMCLSRMKNSLKFVGHLRLLNRAVFPISARHSQWCESGDVSRTPGLFSLISAFS